VGWKGSKEGPLKLGSGVFGGGGGQESLGAARRIGGVDHGVKQLSSHESRTTHISKVFPLGIEAYNAIKVWVIQSDRWLCVFLSPPWTGTGPAQAAVWGRHFGHANLRSSSPDVKPTSPPPPCPPFRCHHSPICSLQRPRKHAAVQ
jgi:hypothetical protein